MNDQTTKIMKMIGRAQVTPGENIAFIGVSLDCVRRNIWGAILNAYDRRWLDKRIQDVDTVEMSIVFTSGSKVRCYGINRPDQLRGQRLTAVYLDKSVSESEAALMMQLAMITAPFPADAPMPQPVFGL